MSLTKQAVIDQITVTENGTILYREATRIMEDGNQISQTYHRSSISPGASLDNVPPQVALIAQATWTDDVINAYQTNQAEEAAKIAATQPTA